MYQNFKITKLEPKTVGNQEYMLCDFKYQLLTGAGFEVDRKGVASVTSEGKAVEVLPATLGIYAGAMGAALFAIRPELRP